MRTLGLLIIAASILTHNIADLEVVLNEVWAPHVRCKFVSNEMIKNMWRAKYESQDAIPAQAMVQTQGHCDNI
jgi:hypothetical protein